MTRYTGSYRLILFGQMDGTYSVGVTVFRKNGAAEPSMVATGTIQTDQRIQFNLDVNTSATSSLTRSQ